MRMHYNEVWRQAVGALYAHKLRAMLTTIGVVIGSACIVLVVTVALTGKRYILAQIEGIGANIIFAELIKPAGAQSSAQSDELTLDDLEAIRTRIPQVVEVAGTRAVNATIIVEGHERAVSLVGITDGFQRIRNFNILSGRFLDSDDMAGRNKVCLLTRDLARLVFQAEDPTGKVVRIGELQLTVVGVFQERVGTLGQSEIQSESVVVPFPLIRNLTGTAHLKRIYAQAVSPAEVVPVTHLVAQELKGRHRPGAVYNVENLTSLLEAAGRISFALTVVLLVIAAIALLISGIGIMNIMIVTVTERTREIGIRMALGARRGEVRSQFLLEAFLISAVGAIGGVGIAIVLAAVTRPVLQANGILDVPVSWQAIVIALVVSAGTGILFGYLPANRAAQFQPTESLRHEL